MYGYDRSAVIESGFGREYFGDLIRGLSMVCAFIISS
jgi:hypothetical protein